MSWFKLKIGHLIIRVSAWLTLDCIRTDLFIPYGLRYFESRSFWSDLNKTLHREELSRSLFAKSVESTKISSKMWYSGENQAGVVHKFKKITSSRTEKLDYQERSGLTLWTVLLTRLEPYEFHFVLLMMRLHHVFWSVNIRDGFNFNNGGIKEKHSLNEIDLWISFFNKVSMYHGLNEIKGAKNVICTF